MLINKIYRKICQTYDDLRIFILKSHYKLKYPSIKFVGKVYIGRGVNIICSNESQIVISNSSISDNTYIHADEGGIIKIIGSFLGQNCVIVALNEIAIDENCEIAEMVVIRDQNHKHDKSTIPIKDQTYTTGKIVIEKNVWIGAKATILEGTTIGENSVIGAMSLVNKSIPKGSTAVGIPAKIIKSAQQ